MMEPTALPMLDAVDKPFSIRKEAGVNTWSNVWTGDSSTFIGAKAGVYPGQISFSAP